MFLNVVIDALERGWNHFVARPQGMMNFRFIIQPILATVLALRAGINDAKKTNPAGNAFFFGGARSELSRTLWKGIKVPFFIGAILDSIYQVIIHQGIFLLELLFTVVLLVVIPYYIVRTITCFIGRFYFKKKILKNSIK